MKAYIYDSDEKLSLQEVPRPEAEKNSAVIQVNAASICGTDLRTYRFGSKKIKPPRIIGHEVIGTITELGDSIEGFSVGDRVQIAPALGCGTCYQCRRGHTNLCGNLKTIGFDFDGTFAEYMEIPPEAFEQKHVSKVPADLESKKAVLTEPIACIVNAQQYLNIEEGDYAAIFGSGFIGSIHAQLAFHKGAEKVIMIDVNDSRLENIKKMLPELTAINSTKVNLKETIMEITEGRGVDVAITACSVGSAQSDALSIIAKHGRVSLFGGLPRESTGFIDSNIIHYNEVSVFGAHASTVKQNAYAMELIASGALNVDPFVSRTFSLDQIEEAFTELNSENIVKAVIIP